MEEVKPEKKSDEIMETAEEEPMEEVKPEKKSDEIMETDGSLSTPVAEPEAAEARAQSETPEADGAEAVLAVTAAVMGAAGGGEAGEDEGGDGESDGEGAPVLLGGLQGEAPMTRAERSAEAPPLSRSPTPASAQAFGGDGTGRGGKGSRALEAVEAPLGAERLAPGWKAAPTADGRTYYYHVTTRQTTWKMPLDVEEAVVEVAAVGDGFDASYYDALFADL